MTELQNRQLAFLQEYAALCEKHGMCIEACGCCNSPYFSDFTDTDSVRLTHHLAEILETGERALVEKVFGGGTDLEAWNLTKEQQYEILHHILKENS